ncbi:MAG: S-layer protein, partial [Firmicutes bacterium]|nr:S-layer protein [Bacillota bacterium]
MRKSKRLSWLLAVIFVFTTMLGAVPSQAVAADLGDISNHWAKSQIESLIERGIVTGYPDNTFKPDNTITRAEFITMINKAYSFTATAQINYTDVPASAWYATEIAKAKAAGYIAGYEDGTMRPNAQISRQEAAKIVSTILKLDTSSDSALSAFTDAAAIPAWSRGYVAAMVKAGYITGYPDGTFKAGNAINRAEAAVILGRVIGAAPAVQKEFTKAGTYGPASGTQTINGDVVVNADGVILQNTIINGNLLVAEPVGEGSVNFKNVTVSGTTTIKGGGINSVTFDNCKVNIVVVNKPSSPVRVVFLNNSTTTKLQLDSAATVVGGGIAQAIVNADSIFDKTPTTYTVANGINAKFGSKSVTGPAEYTEPSSGGSSGGGGGGPVNVPVTGVSLSSNNLSIDKGHTATLTATITPTGATNQNLIWTSNNTSIASVSSGVVTALEGGNAIITVTTADGNYTDTCNVTVAGIAVETINFKRASLNLMVGAGGTSATLVPIIAPVNASDQTVTWESENTAIATVVNGLVTPIAAGVTSITATTNDGAKTATCVVTVTNAPVAVTDVNLNTETLTLAAGGAGYTLVEIIAPANATNTNVIWTSS